MNVERWNRHRSSRNIAPAEYSHRVRRVLKSNGFSFIIVEVSRIHSPGDQGFYCGWQYLIYDLNKDGMRRGSNMYSEEFETRELAMFMADLKLIDLGFELKRPFEFIDD